MTSLPGIRECDLATSRLRVHLREAGSAGGTPVVLLHGNCSSGAFYEELMLALPDGYRAIAPDLRGYGDTEALAVDARRGLGDWADDLRALVDALGLERFHLVGWSMGGGVAMRYAADHPADLLSLTLIAPLSPYGFGGTKGLHGEPCFPDFAGSGGGIVNAEFARRLGEGDRSAESPFSPLNVMNSFYFKPPFRGLAEQEARWLESLLKTRVGADFYPGDAASSPNWPGLAPGERGFANAMSPKYHRLDRFAAIEPKPPILWIRGDSDQIVSDTSMLDIGTLGSLGLVAGWPGNEVFPPQPMVSQTRAVLEAYRAKDGDVREFVMADAGHSPHLEKPDAFQAVFFPFLAGAAR